MPPHLTKLVTAIELGLTKLTWKSMTIDNYVKDVSSASSKKYYKKPKLTFHELKFLFTYKFVKFKEIIFYNFLYIHFFLWNLICLCSYYTLTLHLSTQICFWIFCYCENLCYTAIWIWQLCCRQLNFKFLCFIGFRSCLWIMLMIWCNTESTVLQEMSTSMLCELILKMSPGQWNSSLKQTKVCMLFLFIYLFNLLMYMHWF